MTITNGIPAGGGSRSNTAYVGSYQESLAVQTSHALKQRDMLDQAASDSRASFTEGQDAGYAEGWNAAMAIGNERILQQAAFTRKHVEDKKLLEAELAKQTKIIDTLEARVQAIEEENQRLRDENGMLRTVDSSLRELIQSLRSANEQLKQQVTELDANFKERTQQYVDQLWQYNRAMVFVSTVGGVLEELTRENTPEAQHARELFAARYAHEVDKGLKMGTIKMAPDIDPAFGKFLPKTRQFISDLLVMAQADKADSPSVDM
ncbi:hypothetical protein [Castellaniella sp.]|uniref:hypothetical protein n=1 Tax=Castellaniella sp. TaxID=1955812 RepID=UPI002AFF5205|nr:hypothetical protein [Castellaniella sp.]